MTFCRLWEPPSGHLGPSIVFFSILPPFLVNFGSILDYPGANFINFGNVFCCVCVCVSCVWDVLYFVGLLGCCVVGFLGSWILGLLGCFVSGLLVCWVLVVFLFFWGGGNLFFGLLVCWVVVLWGSWVLGFLVCWVAMFLGCCVVGWFGCPLVVGLLGCWVA